MRTRTRIRAERGAALVFTILALGVLMVLGFGITSVGMVALKTSGNERETSEVLALADAGISHAKRLILWQEWGSFDQFLKRGNAAACDGDELSDVPLSAPPPYSPLPVGYPTDAVNFIPATGKAFGAGTYLVRVCDDHSTDFDSATGALNGDPNSDANHRILVRSTGIGRNGASATIEMVIGAAEMPAVIVNGDLEVAGNPTVSGSGGIIHANGDMVISGNPCAQQYFSAVEDIPTTSNAEGGATCTQASVDARPSSDPWNVPMLTPLAYKAQADFWLALDGTTYRMTATGWTPQTLTGWTFASASKTWSSNSNISGGTYYVEGNVILGGSPGTSGAPLPLTILVEGYLDVGGNPTTVPDLVNVPFVGSIAVIAGTDLKLRGSSSIRYAGLYYARHQLDVSGEPVINGQLLAANLADTWYPDPTNTAYSGNNLVTLVNGRMRIGGNPTINFASGGLFAARMRSWRECRELVPGDINGPCGAP